MQEIRYADAGMDMKKLGLCFMRKCWLAIVAAVVGAALGGALYTFASMAPESEREYRADSKVYLDFAADETGEVYQHYNGYTWNDLMTTDPIMDVTMQYLPEGYEREEVAAATKAEILSDVRLLTITITTHDADRCDMILKATNQSLSDLGNTAKEFQQIRVIRTAMAELVIADDRTRQAVTAGMVLAVVLTLLGMMFCYVLDDRIMIAGDLKPVTDVPFVGYMGAGERFQEDYEGNLAYLRGKADGIMTLIVTQGKTGEGKGEDKAAAQAASVIWEPGLGVPAWEKLCAAGVVVVVAEYGKVHAAYLAYVLEQMQFRGCQPSGIAISGADRKFLRRYYGLRE